MDANNGNEKLPFPSMCREGCGFYGSPTCDGLCSKCYKDVVARRQENNSPVQQLSDRSSPVTGMSNSLNTRSSIASAIASNVTSTSLRNSIMDTITSSAITQAASSVSSIEKSSTTSASIPSLEKVPDKSVASSVQEAPSPTAKSETVNTADDSSKDMQNRKPKKKRCLNCKKKVGLTGFECRCGGLFCATHRYSDKHDCTFDYKELAQQEIRKNNPVVVGEKISKI